MQLRHTACLMHSTQGGWHALQIPESEYLFGGQLGRHMPSFSSILPRHSRQLDWDSHLVQSLLHLKHSPLLEYSFDWQFAMQVFDVLNKNGDRQLKQVYCDTHTVQFGLHRLHVEASW